MKFNILIVLFCLILISSCTTSDIGYNDSDADYVMNLALDNAINKGVTKTASYISATEDFIPQSCNVLNNRRYDIAGLDTVLSRWTEYARTCSLDMTSDFQTMVEDLRENTVIQNPIALAQGQSDSVTEYFAKENYSKVQQSVLSFYSTMDTSLLEQAIAIYNRWVLTNKNLKPSKSESQLVVSYLKETLATEFTDKFFSFMASAEELYRTTPQPDMENVVERVLGLE